MIPEYFSTSEWYARGRRPHPWIYSPAEWAERTRRNRRSNADLDSIGMHHVCKPWRDERGHLVFTLKNVGTIECDCPWCSAPDVARVQGSPR